MSKDNLGLAVLPCIFGHGLPDKYEIASSFVVSNASKSVLISKFMLCVARNVLILSLVLNI